MGGLGNQIFQYAFGQVQAANGIDAAYDRSWFVTNKTDTPRPYLLDKFPIKVKESSLLKQQTIYESGYDPKLFFIENCNFDGYWQYTKYYDPILSRLQTELVVSSAFYTSEYLRLKNIVKNESIIALHVRRGDYVTTTKFKVLPLFYYYEALLHVKGNVFIFSDDLLWGEDHFKQEYFARKITFIDLPDYLSFDLMRQCSNFIISNSTFSTLAAYLSTNPDKIVVGSKDVCIESKIEREKNEHLPKDWILL
jgi:hypothetical protein